MFDNNSLESFVFSYLTNCCLEISVYMFAYMHTFQPTIFKIWDSCARRQKKKKKEVEPFFVDEK